MRNMQGLSLQRKLPVTNTQGFPIPIRRNLSINYVLWNILRMELQRHLECRQFLHLCLALSNREIILYQQGPFLGPLIRFLSNILPRFGVTTTYVDINKPELWETAFQENTKLVYIETPSNPSLDIVDLAWVSAL